MSIVVTGAAGFIGSHVVEALLARGDRVVGVDNLEPFYDPAIKRANIELCRRHPRGASFEFVQADITDAPAMRRVFIESRARGLIHLAGKAGVRPSLADPAGYAHANVTGTAVVLQAASGCGVDRAVIASSSSVYGNNAVAPFSEEHAVDRPISPYAATKRCAELVASAHTAVTGLPTGCLRFFTVFGPRQRPDLAIGKFLRMVARGEPIPVFGDGSSRRDYTFIDDIVRGVLSAYESAPGFGHRVWNLGGSEPVTLSEMVRTIGQVVGRDPVIDRKPNQPGDVDRTWADLARARAELGFQRRVGFREGVERQWAWMKESGV